MRKLAFALFLLSVCARAHDLWMIEENGRVLVRIGEDFPVATNGITADRVVFLRMVGAGGGVTLEGRAEEKQFAAALPPGGPRLVELEVKPRFITLKAPDFNRYIQGEGFAHVIAARKAAGASDSPGREIYSRYSKLLIEGPGDDRHLLAPRGHRLEIVPLANPARLPEADDLEVQVLFEGKPLAGAQVSAGAAGMKGHQFAATVKTGPDGRARLRLSGKGLWYIRLIHMIPSAEPEADWRSFFGTMVFQR